MTMLKDDPVRTACRGRLGPCRETSPGHPSRSFIGTSTTELASTHKFEQTGAELTDGCRESALPPAAHRGTATRGCPEHRESGHHLVAALRAASCGCTRGTGMLPRGRCCSSWNGPDGPDPRQPTKPRRAKNILDSLGIGLDRTNATLLCRRVPACPRHLPFGDMLSGLRAAGIATLSITARVPRMTMELWNSTETRHPPQGIGETTH